MNKDSLTAITECWKPEDEVWAAPVLAKPGFWHALKTDRMLLVVGGNEVYRDDVCRVAMEMNASTVDARGVTVEGEVEKGHSPARQLIVCPGEMHCQASLDMSIGITDGYMTQGIGQWLLDGSK